MSHTVELTDEEYDLVCMGISIVCDDLQEDDPTLDENDEEALFIRNKYYLKFKDLQEKYFPEPRYSFGKDGEIYSFGEDGEITNE